MTKATPPAPTSTIRPIKDIAMLLMVSPPKKDEISNAMAQAIIELRVHAGQLPWRTMAKSAFSSVIQPKTWGVMVGDEKYNCHLMADFMKIWKA